MAYNPPQSQSPERSSYKLESPLPDRYPATSDKCPHFLQGGDYNPDPWTATPEVWDQDVRLMKLAGCNAMSTGIFSRASLARPPRPH